MFKTPKSWTLLAAFFLTGAHLWGAAYEFEGVGARQVARGGAAIADSDDWTAIYWNPANIANRRSREFGVEIFSGEVFGHDSDSLSNLPGQNFSFAKNDLHSNFILGAVGAVFPVGKKGGIGMGFYTPLLQGVDFAATDTAAPNTALDLEGSATILTWTLNGSYQLTPVFSLGAGINFLYGRFKNDIALNNYNAPGISVNSSLDGDGFAPEGIFGFRYDPNQKTSLGFVFRTGADVEIKGDATADNNALAPSHEESDFKYDLRHPATWGLGAAFRPSEKLTLSADYNRTLWNRFVSNIRYDTPGNFLPNLPNQFDWNDSWKIRVGMRYKMSTKNEWLAGYAYDVPALDSNSVDFSTTIDVYMNRVSLGFAHAWNEQVETILSVLGAYGERDINNQNHRLSGYQVMLETRFGSL